MRNEGTALEEAIAETIRVGELAGCRVQISHLKVDSPNRWGASASALALIDAARARGVDVEADQYAYTAASSTLGIRFPSWALEGGQPQIARAAERSRDVGEDQGGDAGAARRARPHRSLVRRRRILRADPSLNGLSMKQVAAKLQGADSADAQLEAAREMMLAGGASMVYHFMSDDDVERIMRHPQVALPPTARVLMLGEGVPHPRGYGNNARVLGEYVRKRHVIPLEEAIRKMTSLPAEHFKFREPRPDHDGYVGRHRRLRSARRSATPRRSRSRTPLPRAFPTCSSTAWWS